MDNENKKFQEEEKVEDNGDDGDVNNEKKENQVQEVKEDKNEKPVEEYKKETDVYYIEKSNHNNIRKRFIDGRYDRMMYLLNNPPEIDRLLRKRVWGSIKRHSAGCLWGIAEGIGTGATIGGKWGGGGGWIIGGITQGVGFLLCPIFGAIICAIIGIFTSKEEMSLLGRDYRYSLGSTMGAESIKPNLELFPGYSQPNYITNGDRKSKY